MSSVKITDAVDLVYKAVSEEFNAELAKEGLSPLSYQRTAPIVESCTNKMGIYLSSPSGEDYQSNGRISDVSITMDCLLTQAFDDSNLPEKYLSILVDYLNSQSFCFGSYISTAVTARCDLRCSVNGFALCLVVRVAVMHDDIPLYDTEF